MDKTTGAAIATRNGARTSTLERQLGRIPFHIKYLSYAFGRHLRIGSRAYKMHGYFPNKFYAGKAHEKNLLKVIRTLFAERPGAFIDVGTNTGQTLCKVLEADPQRQYIGFEPQVACCFYIDQFARTNAINTVQVFPFGLGESDGFLSLYNRGYVDEMASFDITSATLGLKETLVSVRRGDDMIERLRVQDIAVIKIDVEGFEIFVLRGLEKTLRRSKPAVIFEVLPNFSGLARTPVDKITAEARIKSANAILAFFSTISYSVHQIDDSGQISAIEAFNMDDPKSYIGSNYVALPYHISTGIEAQK